MAETLEKRKWCYVQPPAIYEIAPCACGNSNTQWSEYQGRLWCSKCEIDFIPEHNGIFDGPIPAATCGMLGIYFDRINLETNEIEPFEFATFSSLETYTIFTIRLPWKRRLYFLFCAWDDEDGRRWFGHRLKLMSRL